MSILTKENDDSVFIIVRNKKKRIFGTSNVGPQKRVIKDEKKQTKAKTPVAVSDICHIK